MPPPILEGGEFGHHSAPQCQLVSKEMDFAAYLSSWAPDHPAGDVGQWASASCMVGIKLGPVGDQDASISATVTLRDRNSLVW